MGRYDCDPIKFYLWTVLLRNFILSIFFQPFKNAKAILSSRDIPEQAVGRTGFMGRGAGAPGQPPPASAGSSSEQPEVPVSSRGSLNAQCQQRGGGSPHLLRVLGFASGRRGLQQARGRASRMGPRLRAAPRN